MIEIRIKLHSYLLSIAQFNIIFIYVLFTVANNLIRHFPIPSRIPYSLFVYRYNNSATLMWDVTYFHIADYTIIDNNKIVCMRPPDEIKTCRDNSGSSSDVGVGFTITERGRRNDDAESPAPAGIANWGWTGVPVAAGVCWPLVDRARTSGWWWAIVARSSRRGVVARATTASWDTRSRG